MFKTKPYNSIIISKSYVHCNNLKSILKDVAKISGGGAIADTLESRLVQNLTIRGRFDNIFFSLNVSG